MSSPDHLNPPTSLRPTRVRREVQLSSQQDSKTPAGFSGIVIFFWIEELILVTIR